MILQGWGRYPRIDAQTVSCETAQQLYEVLGLHRNVIVYGMGRSYGDSALNPSAILSTGFNKILSFDRQQGTLTCESGVSLAELMDVIVPEGWFFAVTPGTKYVTIGGAIAGVVSVGHGHTLVACGCSYSYSQSHSAVQMQTVSAGQTATAWVPSTITITSTGTTPGPASAYYPRSSDRCHIPNGLWNGWSMSSYGHPRFVSR